jgi:hypothetical protein
MTIGGLLMDTVQLEGRIERLRDPQWSPAEIHDFYGITVDVQNSHLFNIMCNWASDHRVPFKQNGTFNRHTLERFFASSKAVPRKWMAIQLGMGEPSLVQLLDKLKEIQLIPLKFSDELVAESLQDDLLGLFDEFRFRTLKDHNDWCKRLHEAIHSRFELVVDKAECSVSRAMNEVPARYAMTFDAITLEALSTKYSVWVDFGKPISLPPDRCSRTLYWEHHDILHPFLLGTREPEPMTVGGAV